MDCWPQGRNVMSKEYHGAKILIHGDWEAEQRISAGKNGL